MSKPSTLQPWLRSPWARRKWRLLRQEVFERDNYRCRKCGATEHLHCHHVRAVADGGDPWAGSNLTSLCRRCHRAHHARHPARGGIMASETAREWDAVLAETFGDQGC